jgi:Spy/CpxP family protein refolding chaperone
MNAKARGVLGAMSLVVLGMVLGVAIDRHLLLNEPHASAAAALHEMTMSSIEERLDLTSDQRRQIESIITARHNSLLDVWQAVHSHLGAAIDTLHQEIEAILTPAQRSEFREWLREADVVQ